MSLLKNDTQLKQKSDKQQQKKKKKKISHPNLIKNKNYVQLKKKKKGDVLGK